MTDETSDNQSIDDSVVFDVNKVRELIELMKEYDLSEIDLLHKPRRIRLRRGATAAAPLLGYPLPPQMPAVAPGTPAAAPPVDDPDTTLLASPMVGTYYSKPKPDQPNFVKVGDQVDVDTIVCLVEAMKMFNEIPAGVAGTIVEIIAKNEEAVDVGKPLLKIKTA